MYSEPLVKWEINKYVSAGDPVNYEKEILRIDSFLKETSK